MSTFESLSQKVARRDVVCGVVGLGYVGLPLAVEMGKAGLTVIGLEVSPRVVDLVNRGESHIKDVAAADVTALRDAGRLEATTDMARLSACDVISICVPTPLGKTKDPDMSFVVAASEAVAEALRPGQLIVLESTTYPGTTREVLLPLFERRGLAVGEDFYLCFSPERVDPGNGRWHTKNTPKVLGGVTPQCVELGKRVYELFIDQVVPVSSPEAAELTKLLENTFRMINNGLVNEMAVIADKLGVDIWEVIEAAATKPFGFMKFTPGPGLGGHCIPLDPHYLAWKMRTLHYKTRMIELAGEINTEMPSFWVSKVQDALNDAGKALKGSRVLVLGVAYKKDIDDLRESPALEILDLLHSKGVDVSYHDPFVPEIRDDGHTPPGAVGVSVSLTDDALREADAVMVVTDHSSIDDARVGRLARIIIDTRHACARARDAARDARARARLSARTGPPESTAGRVFRVVLVGCGRISERHFEAIASQKSLRLVAVCDELPERARRAGEQMSVPFFTSFAELLETVPADVAAICTPSGLHPRHGIMASERGLHVICEKPMATRLDEADELVRMCDEAGVHLFVVKQNRLNPAIQLLKRSIDQGRFGRIYLANTTVRWNRPQQYYDMAPWRGTWEFDGGAFMNQASHYVDMIQWLAGPVDSVVAKTATLARRIEGEDTGVAILHFRSGALGTIEVTMLTYPRNMEGSITIIGEQGTVKVGGTALNRIEHWDFAEYDDIDREAEALRAAPNPLSVYGSGHRPYYENVVRVLRGEAAPGTDGREGRKSLELILGIYESARAEREIALPLRSFAGPNP